MHGPIRNRLEELLNANAQQVSLNQHLASCPECAQQLDEMKDQALLLRTLRAAEEVEPAPGFYARVIQRIEEEGVGSIWSVFVDGPFGKRLALASLALALGLATWLVGVEREDGHMGSEPVIYQEATALDVPVTGDQAHQRDVVLVNLASYSQQSE
jgi:anti-sigma factor RsiW